MLHVEQPAAVPVRGDSEQDHALLLVRVRPGDERPRRPVRRAERLVWHPGGDVSTSPTCPVSTCSRSGPRRKELDPSSTWIADSWASCRTASTPRGRRRCRHSPSAPLLSAEMPAKWSSPRSPRCPAPASPRTIRHSFIPASVSAARSCPPGLRQHSTTGTLPACSGRLRCRSARSRCSRRREARSVHRSEPLRLGAESVRHVHEAAVMPLEGDGDVRGRAVTVLHQHDVGFTCAR